MRKRTLQGHKKNVEGQTVPCTASSLLRIRMQDLVWTIPLLELRKQGLARPFHYWSCEFSTLFDELHYCG